MIANQFRFDNPRDRFEDLMNKTLRLIRERATPEFPSSIFYAYKQREEVRDGVTSTGWDTMLTALVNAGFRIVGTWPMRTERSARPRSLESNALASSVVLVCRPRDGDMPIATRREFTDALRDDLPPPRPSHPRRAYRPRRPRPSRHRTRHGDILPILPLRDHRRRAYFRDALIEINRALAFYHRREQGDLDPESRFCMDWLREFGFAEGACGAAEVLARALNVSVESMDALGLLTADAGGVRLHPVESCAADVRPCRRPDA